MDKVWKFLLAIMTGFASVIGAIILFTPRGREGAREHYRQSMQAAREASAARRAELEAELARIRQGDAEEPDGDDE